MSQGQGWECFLYMYGAVHLVTTSFVQPKLEGQFLIPLTKHLFLNIGKFLSDKFLFTQKLRELQNLIQGKISQQGFTP